MDNKILFVDVEWNQIGKRLGPFDEILEIGTIASIDGYVVNNYFKYINPEKLVKRQTFNFLGITPNDLKNGEILERALHTVQAFWNDSDCIVIWSLDALNIIKSVCKRKDIVLNPVNVIVFQNILNDLLGIKKLSFEDTLLRFNALYDRTRMHNAGFDSQCLKSLFEIICNRYKSILFTDSNQSLVENSKTKVMHKYDCIYVNNIKNSKRVPIYKIFTDQRCCKRCLHDKQNLEVNSQDEEYQKIKAARKLKGKSVTFEQIDLLAEYFHLQRDYQHAYVLVITEYSTWKIYYSGGFVTKLEHENYKHGRSGYHNQQVKSRDMFSVMEYIVNHDKNPHKRKRIDDFDRKFNRKSKRMKMQKERRYYEDDRKDWKKYIGY